MILLVLLRPVVPGCANFGRSVNPISTRGVILCLLSYYWHTRIFRPSDGPESMSDEWQDHFGTYKKNMAPKRITKYFELENDINKTAIKNHTTFSKKSSVSRCLEQSDHTWSLVNVRKQIGGQDFLQRRPQFWSLTKSNRAWTRSQLVHNTTNRCTGQTQKLEKVKRWI